MAQRILLLLVLFCVATVAHAQWARTSGPYGGYITGLAANEAGIFAGTYNGLFHSTDNGESWTKAAGLAGQSYIWPVTIKGPYLIVGVGYGTYGNVMRTALRSTDNGRTLTDIG